MIKKYKCNNCECDYIDIINPKIEVLYIDKDCFPILFSQEVGVVIGESGSTHNAVYQHILKNIKKYNPKSNFTQLRFFTKQKLVACWQENLSGNLLSKVMNAFSETTGIDCSDYYYIVECPSDFNYALLIPCKEYIQKKYTSREDIEDAYNSQEKRKIKITNYRNPLYSQFDSGNDDGELGYRLYKYVEGESVKSKKTLDENNPKKTSIMKKINESQLRQIIKESVQLALERIASEKGMTDDEVVKRRNDNFIDDMDYRPNKLWDDPFELNYGDRVEMNGMFKTPEEMEYGVRKDRLRKHKATQRHKGDEDFY